MVWPFTAKKNLPAVQKSGVLTQPSDRGWLTIFESFTGAWQQDVKVDDNKVLAYHAIFSCTTLIARDIAKLRVKVVKKAGKIWSETKKGEYAVIDDPNGYQNRIQFFEAWLLSKLTRGNAYILKARGAGGKVIGLYVLDPHLVTPLVSTTGDVFYRLTQDNMTGLTAQETVPASEIIHDRFNCLFHPLIGLSPIFANGVSAVHGMNIQNNSTKFFGNMSRPSGILTAPGEIPAATAAELKEAWEKNFSGDNIGKTAVLGNDLKYMPLSVNAEQSQLVEQLRLSAEIVCATYHVPKYKVIGDPPSYNNIESLELQYYSQCLQSLMEDIELCLAEGLGMSIEDTRVEFDLTGLLRMDSKTQIETLGAAVGKTIMTPNEARGKVNLAPLSGGDALYLQEQNYSLDALAKRDAKEDPFASAKPKLLPPPANDPAPPESVKDFSPGICIFKGILQ